MMEIIVGIGGERFKTETNDLGIIDYDILYWWDDSDEFWVLQESRVMRDAFWNRALGDFNAEVMRRLKEDEIKG